MSDGPRKKQKFICPICQDIIIDATNKKDGHDSIFCDGHCQTWLHRTCASLSKPAFDLACKSNNPFFCPNCRLDVQDKEILSLKSTINNLATELASLKKSSTNSISYSQAVSNNLPAVQSSVHPVDKPEKLHRNPVSPTPTVIARDRKQNVVIYGIPECPKGTHRHERIHLDDQSASKVISTMLPTFTSLGIKDCFRLGKYDDTKPRPRPLLVQLNRVSDVSQILAKRSKLYSSTFRVHPDLPPAERKTLSLLLSERKHLIACNTDKKVIKIRNHCLYVNNKLHASVFDGTLQKHPTLGDHSAELQHIAVCASATTSTSPSEVKPDQSIPNQ